MEKACLVLQGGGFRGAFTAGVLDVLNENEIAFETIVGVSIGALCLCNYISNQPYRSINILRNSCEDQVLSSYNMKSRLKGKTYSYEYLFTYSNDVVPPFDYDKFYSSKVRFIAVTTSLESGKPQYTDISSVSNPFDVIFASASIPAISKGYLVNGVTSYDGGTSDPIPYEYAKSLGYDKILIIETQEKSYRKGPMPKKNIRENNLYFRKHKEYAKALNEYNNVYNKQVDYIEKEEENGHNFVLRPSINAYISLKYPTIEKLNALYEDGRKCALDNLEKIREYLSE
ncbi:MAG: patatin family protein [Coprobacillus sp.]|nr:patatin family protein [Coprobacillus sp.]